MTMVRSSFVAILAVGLVVTLGRMSFGHGEGGHGGGGHASHGEEHHSSHHEEHHGAHGEGHHEEHHDAHHEEHHDEHHDAHHDEHHGDHHEGHHDEHHDGHYTNHRDEHHDAHRDDHRDDRHAHDDHHGFDHHDWYKHEWWHHHPTWHHQPWQHWWHCATPQEIGAWSAGWGLAAPIYYDYGPRGNVVYRDHQVYVNGALAGTSGAYANSAVALATAGPVGGVGADQDQPGDWLPLGTFAVLRNADDAQPSLTLQLAVNKSGGISGVLFDLRSDTSAAVRGSVDRATQRVAFDLGAKSGLVAETGFYNLTRDTLTLLVHKGSAEPQTYTLIRFRSPPPGAKEEDIALSAK